MAVIYLTHDKHGAKVACSEQEAKYDESHGWKRVDMSAPPPAAAPEPPYTPPPSPPPAYEVTAFNGMQPSNAMPKPRRSRRSLTHDGGE